MKNQNEGDINILLVEDNPGDARLIREALTEAKSEAKLAHLNLEMERVERLEAALERLGKGGVDAVLLDLSLPDSHGIDTFLKVSERASKIPVVLLTIISDQDLAMQAIKHGAQDYLIKGQVDGHTLLRVLRYSIERKRLERFKADFIHNVNHELRVPITSIHGSLLLMQKELTDHPSPTNIKQRRLCEIALQGTEHLLNMVEDLLEVTRLDVGQLAVQPVPLAMTGAIPEILSWLESMASQKNIALSANVPKDLPQVMADPKRFRQILTNLLSNAIKFTPKKGSIAVSASVCQETSSVRVAVTDTGCGLKPGVGEKIFDRLYKGSDSDSNHHGLGLGLYITKELVERHGGKIWVESKPEEGSTFFFTLPIVKGTERKG